MIEIMIKLLAGLELENATSKELKILKGINEIPRDYKEVLNQNKLK